MAAKRNHEILDHYRNYWGDPEAIIEFDLQELTKKSHSISIAEFSPHSENEDWVYATIGAADLHLLSSDLRGDQTKKIEFFIYSRRRNQEIVEFLAGLAVYSLVNKTFLFIGDTIVGDRPIVNGSKLRDILLTYPYFESKNFAVIHHNDNTHSSMAWVVPIFPSEREFLLKNGWDGLEDLFRENETDTSNFYRQAVA